MVLGILLKHSEITRQQHALLESIVSVCIFSLFQFKVVNNNNMDYKLFYPIFVFSSKVPLVGSRQLISFWTKAYKFRL